MARCTCYHQHGLKFLCYGTKEMEECSCGGDTSKCNFYPEKRKQKMTTDQKKIKAMEAINRALGWLEGISYGIDSNIATGIIDAVQCIEESLKEVLGDE